MQGHAQAALAVHAGLGSHAMERTSRTSMNPALLPLELGDDADDDDAEELENCLASDAAWFVVLLATSCLGSCSALRSDLPDCCSIFAFSILNWYVRGGGRGRSTWWCRRWG